MNKKRIRQLQSSIVQPLLIKKKENLFYLTGQWFMQGFLLVKKNDVIFFGDGLEKVEGIEKIDRLKYIGKYLGRSKNLQLEDIFTFAEVKYLRQKALGIRHKVLRSPVDYQRQIKDINETKLVGKSMKIVEKVFGQVKNQLQKKWWTEKGLAEFIKSAGFKLGAEEVSFPPIVASGANAAIPHHIPSFKRLKAGESIIMDFGFKYKGYCSDFTRTVFLKRVPSRLKKAYNQVEKAYNESIRLMSKRMKLQAQRSNFQTAASFRKGEILRSFGKIKARDIYQKAVSVLAEKKLERYFIHNLGHGTGLEIHEFPNLSPESKDVLENGMVFSIEPGVYIPRMGGIRIEDLVWLSEGKVKKFINVSTKLKDNII